jgi:tripartite-type tricarboxylate transporter receptor subunit TctC
LRIASAQSYPSRPVRLLVGFGAGTPLDIIARLIGQWLSERLGQPFLVENRPGGATNQAAQAVVRAPGDGYTLLMCSSTNAINATLYPKLDFSFSGDIAPVAGLILVPNVMLVNPSVPVKTVPEFIAYAKANPGKINMASAGIGSGGHLAGELFKMMTGVNLVHVPFRGNGPALTALLGGQVEVQFATLASSVEFVRTGKLRALGITTAKRSEALPDLPAIDDSVKGYEESSWYGISAPKGAPANVVQILNKEVNAALVDPNMKALIANLGGIEMPGTPDDFGKLIVEETEKWAKVVRAADIKAD